jgi:hypothetical protein
VKQRRDVPCWCGCSTACAHSLHRFSGKSDKKIVCYFEATKYYVMMLNFIQMNTTSVVGYMMVKDRSMLFCEAAGPCGCPATSFSGVMQDEQLMTTTTR